MSRVKIEIADGILQRSPEGTCFQSYTSGKKTFFRGVRTRVGRWYMPAYAAFQLFGCIHIGHQWLKDGFTVADFTHEYGHYLQERRIGHVRYLFHVAIPSAWSLLFRPHQHTKKDFEIEATKLGRTYFLNQQR